MAGLDFDWLAVASDDVIAGLLYVWFGETPSASEIARWRRRFIMATTLINWPSGQVAPMAASDQDGTEPSGDESAHSIAIEILTSPEMLGLLMLARLICIGAPGVTVALFQSAAGQLSMARRIDAAQRKLPYRGPWRKLITELVAYADSKVSPAGRAPEVWPPSIAVSLPSSALAAMNAGTIESVGAWRNEFIRSRQAPGMREFLLRRLHDEGVEILAVHPGLGRVEPGPPRGVWPPSPTGDDGSGGSAPPSPAFVPQRSHPM